MLLSWVHHTFLPKPPAQRSVTSGAVAGICVLSRPLSAQPGASGETVLLTAAESGNQIHVLNFELPNEQDPK